MINNKIATIRETTDKSWQEIADDINQEFDEEFSADAVRFRYNRHKGNEEKGEYREQHEIMPDGSHKSDKLVKMSAKQMKDEKYLLEAHGYDPEHWKITGAKSSIWNQHNKKDGTVTLYASKITVQKISDGINFDKLIEVIKNTKPVEPIQFKGQLKEVPTYLEIPFFDLHFGNSDLDHYKDTLQETLNILNNTYHEILFIIGQDLFHNDNFKGTTANGTPIDKADMIKAWEDADVFYSTLIKKALEKSPKVSIIFSKGNHDESMAWSFVKLLEAKFPQVQCDTSFEERKAYMLGLCFIGTTHGDKNRTNAAANFSVEFPEMWAKAKTRELHMGHLHRKKATKKPLELINDSNGIIIRELGTGNKIDRYHRDHGYTMAHQEFEIFEYSETKKKRIHYV